MRLEETHGEHQKVIEVEPASPPALTFVGAKKAGARAHQLRALGIVGRGGPASEPLYRHKLLLHPLEHVKRRRDEIVRPLVPG